MQIHVSLHELGLNHSKQKSLKYLYLTYLHANSGQLRIFCRLSQPGLFGKPASLLEPEEGWTDFDKFSFSEIEHL